MAKIIDYGRCYVDNVSKRIRKELCRESLCNSIVKPCGEEYGYEWLNNKRKDKNKNYIFSQKPNISHDLRLLNILKNEINPNSDINKYFLSKVVYDAYYGTSERSNDGFPNKINNVTDSLELLEIYVTNPDTILQNENNFKAIYQVTGENFYKKIGDLHIYEDLTPMRFVQA
jgi:hypothetical protein